MSAAMDIRHGDAQPPQTPVQQRPRSKSALSFGSNKSLQTTPKKTSPKHDRKVSQEKAHLHVATKADPNAAMNEVQPMAAALEKPTLQNLREIEHLDAHGKPLEDPDRSNPTRWRWERPLTTIRKFEEAIDNEYNRRASMMRDNNTEIMSGFTSRRSSYYGGYEHNRSQVGGGYFGNRPGHRQTQSFHANSYGHGGPVGGPRTHNNRMSSDPSWGRYHPNGNGNPMYPSQGYQPSRDTVNTHGSNGSHSDPNSNFNSESSSIERAQPVQRPDLGEQYGFQGFGGAPIMEEYVSGNGAGPSQQQGYNGPQQNGTQGYGGPPPPPAHGGPPPPPPPHGVPIKLTKSAGPPVAHPAGQPSPPEKRKSWLKRRFSKKE